MTKIGPDQVAGFKNIGQSGTESAALQQKLRDEENALNQLIAGYQGARTVFGQAPQMNVPEREKPNFQQGLALTLADALRNIVDTSPRKFRQERQPGVQTFQGLKDQDFERKLQEENLRYQNEAQRIAASQRQAEVGLEGLKAGYEGAGRATDTARQGYQFERTQGFTEAEAAAQAGRFAASHALDLQRFGLDEKQFAEVLRHNGVMESPEFTRTIEGLKAAGYSQEEANGMVFAPMLSAYSDYKRQLDINKKITPNMEAQHVLDGWAREAEIHALETGRIRAATAAHGRSNRPSLAQDPSIARDNKDDAAGIANNRRSISDATNRINGILADPKNYDANTNRLTTGAVTAINKLKEQGAALQAQNGVLRGNIAARGMAPQDIDSLIGELERAFGTEGG